MTDTQAETTSRDAVRDCSEFRKAAYDGTQDNDLMRKNATQCISIMRSHPNNLEVQNCGGLALVALCEKRNLSEFIGDNGGIEALLLSLKRFQSKAGFVKNTVVVFRSLFLCAHNRQRFRIHGGLKLLVSSMKIHPKQPGIQRVSCFLIGVLSCEPDVHRFRIVESGVIPVITDMLTRFDTAKDARMQLNACLVLGNLTSQPGHCEQVVEADWEMTGISHLIRKVADREVAYSALCVFRNVITHHETVPLPLETGRRMTGTLLTFLYQSSHLLNKYEKCHEVAFSLLRSRLLHHDNIIPEDYFLKLCLSYTKAYLETEELQEHAVVGHTCASIRMLLFTDQNRVDFRRIPNSIETLVQAIVLLSSRPMHVEQALLALGNAVFDSEEAQGRAEAVHGIRVVSETMKKSAFSAAVTIASFQALHAICANNHRSVEQATSLSMQALCVKSLRGFKDNPHVQESGLATIATLGQTENGAQALRRASALRVGRRAAEQFPFSQKILLLTERIQGLMDGESAVVDEDGSTVDNVKRQNIASRLLRKLSSRSIP